MFFLSVLLLLVAAAAWRLKSRVGYPLAKQFSILQWVGLILGAALMVGSMAVVVDPGKAGVVVVLGKVNKTPLPSGFHLVNPIAQVITMDIKTQNYTMSNVGDEGQRRGDDSIAVISSDGLTLRLDATIFYALKQEKVPEIYETLGLDVEERIVRSEIRASLRDAAAALTATELYTTKRMAFVEQVTKTLRSSLDGRGILMEQVLLRNVILPEQITRAINDKIAADQEAQKMAFVLLKEKQEAERKRIEAEGQANAQRIVSQSLTPQILEYQRIQALRDIGAKGNLVITPMGGASPLINLQPRK